MATQAEMEEFFQVAKELAKKAGKLAYDAMHKDKKVLTKESNADLVTETDKKVEDLILSTLKESFIGEETTAEEGGVADLSDEPTWMVDPIDGTSNFVHSFPFSAVSIALAVNKEPVVGVVYNFVLDQLFAAIKGGGATMNGNPIHVSGCTDLCQAMLLTELGNNRPEKVFNPKMDCIHNIAGEPNPIHGIRMIGSAALSVCMVAMGSVDGYFEYGIHCWDVAAGVIIVREAGGTALYPTGEPLDIMRRGILCTGTEELSTKLVPYIPHLESMYK